MRKYCLFLPKKLLMLIQIIQMHVIIVKKKQMQIFFVTSYFSLSKRIFWNKLQIKMLALILRIEM